MNFLIIDDEPLVAKTLSRLLRPHLTQIIAPSLTAVDQVCDGGYDLIFCDLMMPLVSGQEIYAMVRERTPTLAARFIFITGGISGRDTEIFLADNDVRILYKPFDRNALREMLEAAETNS